MGRSSRRFGLQSAIRPMRRWRGNGRFSPEGVKRRLGLGSSTAEGPCTLRSPAPTSQHPKHRVARPSGRASTRQVETEVFLGASTRQVETEVFLGASTRQVETEVFLGASTRQVETEVLLVEEVYNDFLEDTFLTATVTI